MFLAVVGFIVLGLMIFLGIITGAFLSAFKSEDVTLGIQENIIAVMFIVFLLIYFSWYSTCSGFPSLQRRHPEP